jgi:D-alanine transaminase
MTEQIVYLNGQYMPLSQATVPVLDRGFIFGDGIYEVVPAYGRQPFRWEQHLARLKRSLAKVGISNPKTDEQWTNKVHELIAKHPWENQFVYMHITRGVAKRDHAFPKGVSPTVFMMSSEYMPVPKQQREQGIAAVTLPDERWFKCDIKSISLLGNVLARQAAADADATECVMFRDGYMTEGAASNVWVVRNGVLLGAPRDNLVLEGIRVSLMEDLAQRAGWPLQLRKITREEVLDADEIMVSSATKEVLAVTLLDGKPVGHGDKAGKPGPAYHALYAAYQQAIADNTAVAA